MADETRPIFVGTELKYTIDIQADGFSMDTDDFLVTIKSTKTSIQFTKEEMSKTQDDKYLFTINTAELGTGEYNISVTAYIPDDDFEDGLRTEVTRELLCVVTS